MATVAERMDTAEDRLDRLERLAELHGAFVTRFEEKVDRYIEQSTREREEDRREAARRREEDRQEAARYREESDRRREEAAKEREEARQETARYWEESERRREEDRREAARYWEESDRRREEAAKEREEVRQEAARHWEESGRRREEDRREAAHYWEESDRRREEDREKAAKEREEARQRADRRREESERERREMNKRLVALAVKMGTVVEDFVGPSVRRMAREIFDCGDEDFFAPRLVRSRSDDRSRRRGFDGLYVGTRGLVLNETDSAPDSRSVRDFVRFFKSGEFFLYFPEYRDLPVVPVFSSLSLTKNLVTMLTRNGIHALAMDDGETMQLLNLDEVRARRTPDGPAR